MTDEEQRQPSVILQYLFIAVIVMIPAVMFTTMVALMRNSWFVVYIALLLSVFQVLSVLATYIMNVIEAGKVAKALK